ncbi:MAG: pyruvate:ferredoxin (flavodoxin) oxidoreductase, partial [Nostoc sp.]
AHRSRALTSNKSVLRGRTKNLDVYYQARKIVNPYYLACPDITQKVMDEFAAMTGRQYQLFEYHGDPEAERVIVLMGSGCEAVHEIVNYLNTCDQKVGVLKVKLYRPYDAKRFVAALPETTRSITVLDCIKEPGASSEPLYLDVVAAIHES